MNGVLADEKRGPGVADQYERQQCLEGGGDLGGAIGGHHDGWIN